MLKVQDSSTLCMHVCENWQAIMSLVSAEGERGYKADATTTKEERQAIGKFFNHLPVCLVSKTRRNTKKKKKVVVLIGRFLLQQSRTTLMSI